MQLRDRQCRARRNADPEKKAQHLQREREKWEERKINRKNINELSERAQRHRRKLWKEQKQKSRLKRKATDPEAGPAPHAGSDAETGPSRLADYDHSANL